MTEIAGLPSAIAPPPGNGVGSKIPGADAALPPFAQLLQTLASSDGESSSTPAPQTASATAVESADRAPRAAHDLPAHDLPIAATVLAIAPAQLYEQKLMASGHLSQLPGHGLPLDAAALAAAMIELDPRALASASPNPSASIFPPVATVYASGFDPLAAPITLVANDPAPLALVSDTAREHAPTTQVAALAIPTADWLARRLHAVVNADGRVEVWLRDYRLAAHEREALVRAALALLQQQGRPVTRISINGVPAWHAPTLKESTDVR